MCVIRAVRLPMARSLGARETKSDPWQVVSRPKMTIALCSLTTPRRISSTRAGLSRQRVRKRDERHVLKGGSAAFFLLLGRCQSGKSVQLSSRACRRVLCVPLSYL